MKVKQAMSPRLTRKQKIELLCGAFPADAEAILAQAEMNPEKEPVVETDYGDRLIPGEASDELAGFEGFKRFAEAKKRILWE